MKAPPEIEEQGLRAYEQAGAFERLRKRRGVLLAYAFAPVVLLGLGWVAGNLGRASLAYGCLAGAIFLVLFNARYWRSLQARHARNLALLASLEKQYGEDLPWLEVERQLAALERYLAESEQLTSGRTSIEICDDNEKPKD